MKDLCELRTSISTMTLVPMRLSMLTSTKSEGEMNMRHGDEYDPETTNLRPPFRLPTGPFRPKVHQLNLNVILRTQRQTHYLVANLHLRRTLPRMQPHKTRNFDSLQSSAAL